jgi:hypothetical protein
MSSPSKRRRLDFSELNPSDLTANRYTLSDFVQFDPNTGRSYRIVPRSRNKETRMPRGFYDRTERPSLTAAYTSAQFLREHMPPVLMPHEYRSRMDALRAELELYPESGVTMNPEKFHFPVVKNIRIRESIMEEMEELKHNQNYINKILKVFAANEESLHPTVHDALSKALDDFTGQKRAMFAQVVQTIEDPNVLFIDQARLK